MKTSKTGEWTSIGGKFCRKVGVYYLWLNPLDLDYSLEIYFEKDLLTNRHITPCSTGYAKEHSYKLFEKILESKLLDKYLVAI